MTTQRNSVDAPQVLPEPTSRYIVESRTADLLCASRIYRREGFVVVRGLLDSVEVEAFITTMHKHHNADRCRNFKNPAITEIPELLSFATSFKVMELSRSLLGNNRLVYYGESSVNYLPAFPHSNIFNVLHVDALGCDNNLVVPFKRKSQVVGMYPALRVGIYLQDHEQFSGGIKVIPRSHHYDSCSLLDSNGELEKFHGLLPYNVPTRTGDVIFWNLNLLHSAGAIRLRDSSVSLTPLEESLLVSKCSEDQFLPFTTTRHTIFFDYGLESPLLDLYVASRSLTRAFHMRLDPLESCLSSDVTLSSFAKANVGISFDWMVLAYLRIALHGNHDTSTTSLRTVSSLLRVAGQLPSLYKIDRLFYDYKFHTFSNLDWLARELLDHLPRILANHSCPV